MRRRLTGAIVSVVALTVLLLGVPLAIAVEHAYQDRATVDLQRRAAESLAEITIPLNPQQLTGIGTERDSEGPFTVYDITGTRLVGTGPVHGDASVEQALGGDPASARTAQRFVVAVPITDRATEEVVGAVWITESASTVRSSILRAYLMMLLVAIVVLLIAWWVAATQARSLARPIERLVEQARQIGGGEMIVEHAPSGVAEVDAVGAALAESSVRFVEVLSRERQFSADVSHQLRTPLTGVRLSLEVAGEVGDPTGGITRAMNELERLERTVDHLLALSRDALPATETIDVGAVVIAAKTRWAPRFDQAGRRLDVGGIAAGSAAQATEAAAEQVLDVLIGNSLEHGAGTTVVTPRLIAGGIAIDVADEGAGIAVADQQAIFTRGHGHGHGIGLFLARALVEADGGRLLLAQPQPPRFSIIYAAAADAGVR